ncbi:MAG: RNA polymerase sigma factor SigZ [Rhodospirillales bacterium]|nr:RNA polymerase sigma factor SigZ [Rhodospirillales bacterium]
MNPVEASTLDDAPPVNDRLVVLWQDYHDKLLGFIRSRVESTEMAEDILQDVFIKIQTNLATLHDSERMESWIYQIVRNAVIDHYRTYRASEELPQFLAIPEPDEEEQARYEISTCLAPMIETLAPPYRDALRLSEIDGLKQKHVAETLGLSLSGAKSRVQRGRAMIQELLTDCCRFERDHQGTMVGYEPKNSDCSGCK